MVVRGKRENATGVCCAAAAGAAVRRICAPRTAAGATGTAVSTSWDFALPGHCDPMLFVLWLFDLRRRRSSLSNKLLRLLPRL